MKRKIVVTGCALCLLLVMVLNCWLVQAYAQQAEPRYHSFHDLEGETIGAKTGAIYLDTLTDSGLISSFVPAEYNNYENSVQALLNNEIDALIVDLPIAEQICASNNGLVIMPSSIAEEAYGIAFPKNSALADRVAREIINLKKDGTIDALHAVWFGARDSRKSLPDLDFSAIANKAENTLNYGYVSSSEPMSYRGTRGEPLGYDVALAMHIAHRLGMRLQPVAINIGSVVSAVTNGLVDMASGALTITEKRAKQVTMVPYFENSVVLVVKDIHTAPKPLTLWQKTKLFFHDTFIAQRQYITLTKGVALSFFLAFVGIVVGGLVGALLYAGQKSRHALPCAFTRFYLHVFKDTLTLTVAMGIYYIIMGQLKWTSIGWLSAGFGLQVAAYVPSLMAKGEKQKLGWRWLKLAYPKLLRSLLTGTSVVAYLIVEKLTVQDWANVSDMVQRKLQMKFVPWVVTALTYFLLMYLLKNGIGWGIRRKEKPHD